jgi:hypothetical protein
MNKAAAVRSASEKAICATTSGLRGKNFQERTTSSPACAFRSVTTAVREIFKAGPSANMSVPSKQNPNVAAKVVGFAPPDHTISNGISLRIEATNRPDDHTPRMSPPAPPSSARTRPSLRSWRTMRPRLPPSARRIAISFRRAVPRASSMFARLRQATRSTTTAIPSNNGAMDFND